MLKFDAKILEAHSAFICFMVVTAKNCCRFLHCNLLLPSAATCGASHSHSDFSAWFPNIQPFKNTSNPVDSCQLWQSAVKLCQLRTNVHTFTLQNSICDFLLAKRAILHSKLSRPDGLGFDRFLEKNELKGCDSKETTQPQWRRADTAETHIKRTMRYT